MTQAVCLLLCVRDLRDQDLDNGSLNGGAARHGTLQSYCTKTNIGMKIKKHDVQIAFNTFELFKIPFSI